MTTTLELPATTLPAGVTSAPVLPPQAVAPVTPAETKPVAPVAPVVDKVAPPAVEEKPKASLLADDETPAAPATEKKPDEQKPAATDVVYDLKIPEKSLLTADHLKGIEAFAKEKKIAPDIAQALVERESKAMEAFKVAHTAEAKAGLDKLFDTWGAESQKDPVIGGEKFKGTVALAKRALNLDPDFKALISASPFGNHPKVLAFLAKVGALTTEDALPPGGSVPNIDTRTPAQRWFPNAK